MTDSQIHMQEDKLIIRFENILQCFMPLCDPVSTLNNIVYDELIFLALHQILPVARLPNV